MINNAMGHIAHLLPAYAAGTLNPAGTLLVRAHLVDCAACQTELAAWQSIQHATNVVYASEIPATDDVLSRAWLRIEAIQADGRTIPATNDAPTPPAFTSSIDHQTNRLSLSSFARRTVELLAVAALITLVLIGSLVALGPGRSWPLDEFVSILPAISGTPATPQIVSVDRLVDTSVSSLPAGRLRVAVDRWTLKPSPSAVTLEPHEGAVLFTVDAGKITVTADGIDHQLSSGELMDVTSEEYAFRNSGVADALAYVIYVSPEFSAEFGYSATNPWKSGDPLVHSHDMFISAAAEAFPGGPAHLALERLTLPPGSALPPEQARPWVWTRSAKGTLGLTLVGEKMPYQWETGVEREFPPLFQNLLPDVVPGTTMRMRNAGDEPLVLYRLTIIPGEAGSATATTPAASPQPP